MGQSIAGMGKSSQNIAMLSIKSFSSFHLSILLNDDDKKKKILLSDCFLGNCLPLVFRHTGLTKQCRPRSEAAECSF